MATFASIATSGLVEGKRKEPKAPPPRSLVEEGKKTLAAYQELFPLQFNIEEEAARRYAGLSQSIVGGYAPELTKTISGLYGTPESEGLYGELNRQALEELQAGSQLTPSMTREVQQNVRAGQAARGMGFGPTDVYEEAMTLGSAGEALKASRRGFAQGVYGMDVARTQPAAAAALQSVFGEIPTPPGASPFNPYASDLYNTNFNADWTNKISVRNYNAAMNAALMGMIGQIIGGGGGAAGAAIGCWVAREVFGMESCLWRLFQDWLFHAAPRWLVHAYLVLGPWFAHWIHDKPRAKAIVRHWMARRVNGHLMQR